MCLRKELETQGNWLFSNRSYLPIIILAIGIVLYFRNEILPDNLNTEVTKFKFYYQYLCLFISLLGIFVRIYTVGYTPKRTSGRNTKKQVAQSLNKTGIYSLVRHPLYLGNFLIYFGICLLTGHLWFIITFCLLFWIYYERIMYAEEQFLNRKFGVDFVNWSEETPAFIPKFRSYVKPSKSFIWKKVIKKEADGIFALFCIFFFFDVVGKLIGKSSHINMIIAFSFLFVTIGFIIAKYLKKKTNFLNVAGR
ncbi:MAG: isoprenylcysteine carboxylmethyltransferase family protein [Candidatus Cloacimonetes bacterium]|nr:isoprenylcysteine carboxylmethyltransferase family protein [Candidatus Cloacimonadota bacterium]